MPRWAGLLLGVAILAAGLAALVFGLSSRDSSRLAAVEGPGRAFADQCARHGGRPSGFRFNSTPPTSGPHEPRLLTGDRGRLSDDEVLHALELGNVVIAYDSADPPRGLRALQRDVAGPFDAELAAAGQAVVLEHRDDVDGVVALAWQHLLSARSADDPALREFVEYWLGRGAAGTGGNCLAAG